MRTKIFGLLLIASVLPFACVIIFLHFLSLNQLENLALQRLNAMKGGVVGYYERAGADILTQVQSLTSSDDLKRTLLLTDEIGIIDQSSLIKSTEKNMQLLNLNYLVVVDPEGKILAQGHETSMFGVSLAEDQIVRQALLGQQVHSLALRNLSGSDELMLLAAAPVWFKNRAIGAVIGGNIFDEAFLNDLKALSGAELILSVNNQIRESTIAGQTDRLAIDTSSNRISSINLGGVPFKSGSFGLKDFSGAKIADILIAINTYDLKTIFDRISLMIIIFTAGGLILAMIITWSFANKIARPITELALSAGRVATGDFNVSLKTDRKDELGKLVESFNAMTADLKDYHQHLIDSERMGAFTQMAQKIAHEIKNPLTPIQISIQDLKRAYDTDDPNFSETIEKSCSTILEEVSSLAKIVKEFSEFARFPSPELKFASINEIISSLAEMYTSELTSNRLTLKLADTPLSVSIDKDQIKRAVHNLLKNALEATDSHGKVEIETIMDSGFAEIVISDNGPGFSQQAKNNLFSPYFTTKPEGTGLGLVIVKKIITEHDGEIIVEDEAGVGSTIRLRIPLEGSHENTDN